MNMLFRTVNIRDLETGQRMTLEKFKVSLSATRFAKSLSWSSKFYWSWGWSQMNEVSLKWWD
jgi:hypothetical protein